MIVSPYFSYSEINTRRCEVPRTLTEITEASRASKKEVGRTYRYISRELKLNLQPASPSVYIIRFCRELELPGVCVDNGVMIGWLGYQMVNGDYEITKEDNKVHQKYRTDMVEVTWR